jgi:hypothetical protein
LQAGHFSRSIGHLDSADSMAGILHHLRGSGDFRDGPSGVSGKIDVLAMSYNSQGEAKEAVLASEAPEEISGIPRGSVDTSQITPTIYRVVVEYASGIAPTNASGAGDSPPQDPGIPPEGGGGNVANNPTGPQVSPNQPLGPELSFHTGGSTERILMSKETRHRVGRGKVEIDPITGVANVEIEQAPDFGRKIGVSKKGIEGCEVYSAGMEFTISRRFQQMTLGYLIRLLSLSATVNDRPFYGCAAGEVLFFGADGNFRQGDNDGPWSISGRFGYRKNRKLMAENGIDAGGGWKIEIPDVQGWNYVWFVFTETEETIGGVKYEVERPRFAYVEKVYDSGDFRALKMDFS